MALYSGGSLMLYFLILLSLISKYKFINMKHYIVNESLPRQSRETLLY
jgi:hypothetical protein